jgi:aspartate kinase
MIVMKFGGSSLQSADAILQAISIIRSRMVRHPMVIVSAHGQVTDDLLSLATETAHGKQQQASELISELKKYHADLIGALINGASHERASRFLNCHFSELQSVLGTFMNSGCVAPAAQDAVLSFGERLSSGIVAMALQSFGISSVHLDARALVCTDSQHTHAAPLLSETYTLIRTAVQNVAKGAVPVMGGFIASNSNGATTTLGRNSSNLTAVLAAAAIGAEEVEIWTDVDGVFRHHPLEVPDQRPIETLGFEEALRMARQGARVLHAEAVQLALEENLSIHIRNSRKPEAAGTRICATVWQAGNTDVRLGAASSD